MKRLLLTIGAGLLASMLVACGGSPTADGAKALGGGNADAGDDRLAGVLDQVKGLEGRERTDRLVELAEQAGGTVSIYTALTNQVARDVQKAFQDEYGLTLEVYRASSEAISRRLLQEATAGKSGADLVETGGTEMVEFTGQGVLSAYESPEREDLLDEALTADTWTGSRIQVYAPAWNTKQVDTSPKSWEDLADPRWDNHLAMETGNADWYMALSEYWLKQGKSPDEVRRLWHDIAEGTFMVSGHSTMRELLSVGEFGMVAALPSYMTEESMKAGSPLGWKPALSPLIIRTQGAGVVKGAPNPAGAMLLMDWMLSRQGAQKIFIDAGIDSVRKDLSVLANVETYAIDVERYVGESRRWLDEFEQVTRLGKAAEGR